jgi:exodeoxyribonuclease-3
LSFTVTTWNINSVRLRVDQVERFLKHRRPDVLCLQETKCPNDMFPFGAFQKLGYGHAAIAGQKGYNGVAIVSRHPLEIVGKRAMCGRDDARHVAARIASGAAAGVLIQNFYVPAGGDVADPEANPKFRHKLDFLDELESLAAAGLADRRAEILVGDLNVAPLEHDVWSHRQLLDVVSHTPIETERLERLRRAGGWSDVPRALVPEPAKLYSWWSYRSSDWAAADKGRRLDHIWTSADLAPAAAALDVFREARAWDKPSDHAPVSVTFDL